MEIVAVGADISRGWNHLPAGGANDRGICPRRSADKRKHFTTFYVKGNIVQDAMIMVRDGEILYLRHIRKPDTNITRFHPVAGVRPLSDCVKAAQYEPKIFIEPTGGHIIILSFQHHTGRCLTFAHSTAAASWRDQLRAF